MEQDEKVSLPFMFVDALRHASKRFRKHPHWKRLEGTPWENDAAVIGADLMSDVARAYEARITELESLLAEAREVVKPFAFEGEIDDANGSYAITNFPGEDPDIYPVLLYVGASDLRRAAALSTKLEAQQ